MEVYEFVHRFVLGMACVNHVVVKLFAKSGDNKAAVSRLLCRAGDCEGQVSFCRFG